ncbi:MAG: hypothetical protein IJM79_07995 [Erysipelotrichaceae bacterium]|nr:hypothetical protein [Erysipelotrichaceae bacterium]
MVEKKKVDVNEAPVKAKNVGKTKEERKKSAMPQRIIAIVFWLLAFACEIAAILVLNKTLYVGDATKQMYWLIGLLVADLILVIIGSQFWKKGNDIDPASEKDKTRYFLQNQMGLIVSVICFFPIILLLLNNKDLDKKTKKIVTAVACVALLVAGLFSWDWNPISEEQYEKTVSDYQATEIFWTRFGHSYHTSKDCPALKNTKPENLFHGSITEALEAGRNDPCDFCVDQS